MDEQRFDALSRSLATGRSRRGVLRAALGVLLGGGAAALATAEASAVSCRPGRDQCTRNDQCCSGVCQTGSQYGRLERNRCGDCPAGTALCNGACTPIDSVRNCGGCGAACVGGECAEPVCVNGGCGLAPINEGEPCDGGSGICQSGTCVTTCTPDGGVCDLNNPGACCSQTCCNFNPPNPPVCCN